MSNTPEPSTCLPSDIIASLTDSLLCANTHTGSPHLLRGPVTLSCGFSICLSCIPPRSSGAPLWRFRCPANDCQISHVISNPKIDVVLQRILDTYGAEDEPDGFSQLEQINSIAKLRNLLLPKLECNICLRAPFAEPLTTCCGHTFCRTCLLKSMDHGAICPACRHLLPECNLFPSQSSNRCLDTLSWLLLSETHDQSAEQGASEAAETQLEGKTLKTPLLVCAIAFPGLPCHLHIFEPRYRLMLRRCLQTESRTFGIVTPGRSPAELYSEYGTMVEVVNSVTYPDGRSMIATVGTSRFRIVEQSMLDGYNTARVEQFEDDINEEESVELEEATRLLQGRVDTLAVSTSTSSLPVNDDTASSTTVFCPSTSVPPDMRRAPTVTLSVIICAKFIAKLRAAVTPRVREQYDALYGPAPKDPSIFSFWVAALLPIDNQEKVKILKLRSVKERYALILAWMDAIAGQWWWGKGSCAIS